MDDLTPEQLDEVRADEALWRRAHAIVARHPRLDVSGVHHTLVQFARTPTERLARSLRLGRAYRDAASRHRNAR